MINEFTAGVLGLVGGFMICVGLIGSTLFKLKETKDYESPFTTFGRIWSVLALALIAIGWIIYFASHLKWT